MPSAASEKPLILVLDDDAESARYLHQTLLKEDLAVEGTTYEHCLEACARLQPDAVLLSATLRQGDPFKLCSELNELADADSPAVIIMTPDDGELIADAQAAGADELLLRPLRSPLIKQAVRRQIEIARLRRVQRESARSQALENALLDSEERYRVLVETFGDIFFNITPDLHTTYFNPTFEKVTGWSRHEWIDQPLLSLVYADDQPTAVEMFERLQQGEPQPPVELRFYTASGEIHYGEFTAQPEYQRRTLLGIWGTIRDITERKLAEVAEHEQRELADSLRDTATALNRTLDLDKLFSILLTQVARVVPNDSSNIMLIEDGIARVVRSQGYQARGIEPEVRAIRFLIEDTPNMRWMAQTGEALFLSDVRGYTGWVKTPSTDWVRSHVGVPISIDERVIGFINLDSAIVDSFTPADVEHLQSFASQAAVAIRNANLYNALRRQADELETRVAERTAEVVRERAQLRAILDSMNEGVIYDEKLRVLYINEALTEMTGYTIDEWHGYLDTLKSDAMTQDSLDDMTRQLFDTIAAGHPWTQEMRIRRKDGIEFDANLTSTHVSDSRGQVIGSVTVIRDVSQEKALADQKARFVAHASHELRTPITNLKTRLYLLQRQPERLPDHLKILNEVTERMRNLVEDLLDVSRFESGVISLRREEIELQALVLDVVQMQQAEAAQKDILVRSRLPPEPVYIQADHDRFVQVVTNLLVNAINYTPARGHVEVEVALRDNSVFVVVSDDGIGISEEHMPYLFQAFYRADTRPGGTGLGLSISRQIVELHGGEITVESQPGQGSRFSVRLPIGDPRHIIAPVRGSI